MKLRRLVLLVAAACAMPLAVAGATAPDAASPTATKPYIAVVNGKAVTVEEFERAFAVTVRQKFYHATPPEGEIEKVKREVADGLVDKALILAEAEKRGVPVDEDRIRETLDGYEQRYGNSPQWKATRERALPELSRELRNQQLLANLEAQVRAIPDPSEKEVRAYYDANKPLFTEPERVHLSVILLKVDPSSPKAVRDQARAEGRDIRERLSRGADFAELAKIHSGDPSAAKGGDLGYIHRGMLSEQLHAGIDALKPGEITEALDVLDGVAIFKLIERSSAKQRELADVRQRAGELLKREQSEQAWKRFVAELRSNATIEQEPQWAATQTSRGP